MIISNLPLISVLVPAYNHEAYVQDAIRSIISQTYTNIELLVLDDGSKDSTWGKINALQAECEGRFSRVWFARQENRGRPETFNTLLHEARGEYLYLIASDDIAEPCAIETLHKFLSHNSDYLMAVGDNYIIDENGTRVYWDAERQNVYDETKAVFKTFAQALQEPRPYVDFLEDDFGTYKTLLRGNYIPNGYLIRCSTMLEVGGYVNEAPLEDWYQNLQISKLGKIKFINIPLFNYRWHSNNTKKSAIYMRYITLKTLSYEVKQVQSSDNSKHKHEINDFLFANTKYRFDLRPIFGVKTVKNILFKKRYIIFLGMDILVSSTSYLQKNQARFQSLGGNTLRKSSVRK